MDNETLQSALMEEMRASKKRAETIQKQMEVLNTQATLISELGEKLQRKKENEMFLIAICVQNGIDISKLPFSTAGSVPPVEMKASLKKPKIAVKPNALKSTNLLEKYTLPSYAASSPSLEKEALNGKPVKVKQFSAAKSNSKSSKRTPASRSIASVSLSEKRPVGRPRSATITLPSESPVMKSPPTLKASIAQTVETAVEKPSYPFKPTTSPSNGPSLLFKHPQISAPVARYGPDFNAQLAKSFESNGRVSPDLSARPAPSVIQLAETFEKSPQSGIPGTTASIKSIAKVKIANSPAVASFSPPVFYGSGKPQISVFSEKHSAFPSQTPAKQPASPSQTPAKQPFQPHFLNETPMTESSPALSVRDAEPPIPPRGDSILWSEFVKKNFSGSGLMPKKQRLRVRGIVMSFLEMKGYSLKNSMMWDEKQKKNDVALPIVFVEECYEFVADRMQLNRPQYILDEEEIQMISGDREAKRRRKEVDYDLDKMEKMNSLK